MYLLLKMASTVSIWLGISTKLMLSGLHQFVHLWIKSWKPTQWVTHQKKKSNNFGIIWVTELVNHSAWKSICAHKLLGLFVSLSLTHTSWFQTPKLPFFPFPFIPRLAVEPAAGAYLTFPAPQLARHPLTHFHWLGLAPRLRADRLESGAALKPAAPWLASDWDRDLDMQRREKRKMAGTVSIHHGCERKRNRLCSW